MKRIMVSTRLEEHVFEALQGIARQQERKPAFLVRKAVEQFIQAANKERKPTRAAD